MNAPTQSPADTLRSALAGLLDGLPPTQAARAVDRLIANYRGTTPTDAPILRDRADVAAYAAYRMPATFEAVRAALAELAGAADWTPAGHLDIGGGTGAAVWAAHDVWPGERPTTVLDWSEPALALGRELASRDAELATSVSWERARIGTGTPPAADLVTISYVLKELTEADRAAVVDAAAEAATGAVVVIEPGTPDGYARIIEARDRLIGAGFHIAAPCPHGAACPIVPGTDWCHFSARVARSSLHRQVKGGSLAYEDEKFAYVAASRFRPDPAAARIVRRPQIRKGQVLLDLCEAEGGLARVTVTKKHGARYREARDANWGDPWNPPA
ncbi:small ribosomal subunit Rsm22 family protein [Streptomyces longispororuber]|uniref:small ribosomal subunit Rsm22 family protein n=1 Tax=Streptomyces longispororuber TaxID=68230 RepID=UPI00210DC6A4|nr:small ribosomal subunit Rsm22 family protein [Streptomyces longispororuber]MCQ4210263.1 small ribosomal subunit Rsm22 family protein [Streptomyces longispororuber]